MGSIFWKLGIAFVLCAVSSFSAHAEQVKCQTESADDKTTVDVAWTHSPGSPAGFQSLTASLKNTSRRWGFTYTVKRKQKNGVVSYVDVLGESSFSLSIRSQEVSGTNLLAEAVMDKGLRFEQKITGLRCAITGVPNPPVAACPKPAELNAKLFTAAKYESVDQIEWLLDCGAAVDAKDILGCTPFLAASDLACGYRAPQSGGHPSDPNIGDTPMFSSRDSLSLGEVLTLLLDRGAIVDVRDPANGETALIKLVKYGHASESSLLVDRKAQANVQDKEGTTALMIAAASGDDILVKTVLDGKPDLSLKNKAGETAYKIAEKAGYTYLLDLLEEKASSQVVQGKDDGTCAPTMVHIFKGKPVEIILKASKNEMFLLTAPDLGLELMAMPGESVSQTITPDKKGTFPFTCGVHGAEKQTRGSFMVM